MHPVIVTLFAWTFEGALSLPGPARCAATGSVNPTTAQTTVMRKMTR
jgi:hypothetical protein